MPGQLRRFAGRRPASAERTPDTTSPDAGTATDSTLGSADSTAADSSAAGPAPAEIPDELVDAAQRGDRAALERLIATVHPHVVRYCRSRVPADPQGLTGADDVAQEVCLAVVAALPGYRRRTTPFLAFVHGIAAHKVADAHRASVRHRAIPVPELPERVDAGDTPEEQVLRSSAADRIGAVLRTLPPQQREILRLRVVVGLTADQTAAVLSMTAGAVRVAQHRALARLRSLLTAAGEGGVDAGGWAEVVG